MSAAALDASGALVLDGQRVFPLALSDAPPPGRPAPSGRDGLAEVAAGGANMLRAGIGDWSAELVDGQIAQQRALLDAARASGLHAWLWLGDVPNLPQQAGSPEEQLLVRIVDGLRDHPALAAWKGVDEPALSHVPPDGLVRAYRRLKALDPAHPLVLTQAPRGTVAELVPYRPAFDVTGADVYPVSYPPGVHVGGGNTDVSVVGDVTRKLVEAAGGKPVWMTLQIAWSGVAPSRQHPDVVPRFPTLREERFMAYQAIANGARGLVFFGGHLVQVARPVDARAGWNWTFWQLVLRPLLAELSSTAVAPALVAPPAPVRLRADAADVEVATRDDGRFLYAIALRRGPTTSRVRLSGLPASLRGGQALFEYVQEPLPPPVGAGSQQFRSVAVTGGALADWFGPHDVHVYRFARP